MYFKFTDIEEKLTPGSIVIAGEESAVYNYWGKTVLPQQPICGYVRGSITQKGGVPRIGTMMVELLMPAPQRSSTYELHAWGKYKKVGQILDYVNKQDSWTEYLDASHITLDKLQNNHVHMAVQQHLEQY